MPNSNSDPTKTAPGAEATGELPEHQRRVCVPIFPRYGLTRHLLRILEGRQRSDFFALMDAAQNLRGTPQEPQDWSKPDEWIPERLTGPERELAEVIWTESDGVVNPRYVDGIWFLIREYTLLEEDHQGRFALTDAGRDFLEHDAGKTVKAIDEREGLARLLGIVAEKGPGSRRDLLPAWERFLQDFSRYRSDSTVKDTLYRRLRNLVDRGLVARSGNTYEITSAGLEHLDELGTDDLPTDAPTSELHQVYRWVDQQKRETRETLMRYLLEMDPIAFEHLVSRLLEEMGYENVEVTSPANDGGVDVVAEIELGITSVREVVQVKRYRGNIGRNVLDQLRGSLHRFNAVRGTIMSTGGFTRGAQNAAFEGNAPPITLINGDKLLDLLIENQIGVEKRTIEILHADMDTLERGFLEDDTSE